MGMTIETKRSGFFKELTPEKAKDYFDLKMHKFLPTIDTLYFSIFIGGDGTIKENVVDGDIEKIEKVINLVQLIREAKEMANLTHEPVLFSHGLTASLKSYGRYAYCLSETDLYDIFFIYTLPNVETPRIVVQLRSFGLWTKEIDNALIEAYLKVEQLLSSHGLKIVKTRENRIDYCYHTNEISSPNKLFVEKKGRIIKNVHSNMKKYNLWGDIVKQTPEGIEIEKDYIRIGSLKGNNLLARVYDKVKEVIEQGYKGFFFKLWYENGLISLYDLFCFEYAYLCKNMNYLAHARLEFYIEYGLDPERKKRYEEILSDKNATLADIEQVADEFMPKTTSIINIEYQTMRKFYYHSDKYTENFKILPEHEKTIPEPLKQIYKIIDNRELFIAYLTDKTLSFKEMKEGKMCYKSFWQRLRNVPINGKKLCEKMLREYSFEMDVNIVKKRMIDAVGSAAVYNDNIETDFIEDISDFLAGLNDNSAYEMELKLFKDGKEVKKMEASLLRQYAVRKAKQEVRLKNRKKKEAKEKVSTNDAPPTKDETLIWDKSDMKIKCIICNKIKPEKEFWTYGGRGSEDLGKCRSCAEIVTEVF